MARVKSNIVTQGLSGMLGGTLVFRQQGGRTIVSAAPTETAGEPSERQKAQRQRFQEAAIYAKAQIADPNSKAEYATEQNGRNGSAYTIAVADFLHAPDIREVDLSGYEGKRGDAIRIRATDDFKVVGVTVRIENGDGSLVEQGRAVQQANALDWVYTATATNADLNGDKITIRASDKPGHFDEEVRSL